MTYLVTSAEEEYGQRVAKTLLESVDASELILLVWGDGHLEFPGAQVRHADFDDEASMLAGFDGADRVLLLSTHPPEDSERLRQHLLAIDAASKCGTQYFAYTSVTRADATTLDPAPVHAATEVALKDSGMDYCFLRKNFHIDNELRWIRRSIEGEPLRTAAGEGRVSWASLIDYADASAAALLGKGDRAIYELGGAPRSYAELAKVIGEVKGIEVQLEQLDEQGYENYLLSIGTAPGSARRLADMQTSIAIGDLEVQNDDFELLLGHPPESIEEALARLLA
jgi:NAD(P)H dehydrogenase (quinone)